MKLIIVACFFLTFSNLFASSRTFSIIKPDAVERKLSGKINAKIEESGLKIVGQKMILMTKNMAEQFYAVHKDKPFFASLVDYMSSGPVVVQVLESEDDNAVAQYRILLGETDPKKATKGTIRNTFALSKDKNSAHGSDSNENAATEISFFFAESELF